VARVRRARALQAYWQDGRLVLENFVTRIAVTAAPVTIEVLDFFGEWRARGDLASAFPQYGRASLQRAVRDLLANTLLVQEATPMAREDERVATEWKHWLPHASFHFATKDAPFANPRQWARMARAFREAAPQPPLVKSYPDAPRTPLPPPDAPDDEFRRVLLGRRTHREFSRKPVPLKRLATLLHYTWGSTGTVDTPNFGPLLLKPSPSGGARHPEEVYVAARHVEGLDPGLYHYNHVDHCLERVRAGVTRAELLAQTVGQVHVGNAGAVCFMTAVVPRSMYKYRSPRAYRILSLETGHLAQTFCLVATWLGLAPFTTAAMADTAIERALGLDGITETVLYVAGVGMPKRVRGRGRGVDAPPPAAPKPARRPRR
jgi:SagB-type dehydrogenase family enzyme